MLVMEKKVSAIWISAASRNGSYVVVHAPIGARMSLVYLSPEPRAASAVKSLAIDSRDLAGLPSRKNRRLGE